LANGYSFVLLVWFALFLILSLNAKAEHLPIKTYTVADGLLRDTVSKIKQDSRGFLWFCTGEGVSRFDGYSFTNFTTDDGLPDRTVNDFLETRNGEIYVATNNGLAKLDPHGKRNPDNSLFKVFLPEKPQAKNINILFEDESGAIWVGTGDGLYKLVEAGGEVRFETVSLGEVVTDEKLIIVTAIIKDRHGALWIGTEKSGLFRLSADGKTEQFTKADGLPHNDIASLFEDKNGRLWVGMRAGKGNGLALLATEPDKNKKVVERIFTTKDGLPSVWITSLFQTSEGSFWLGTTEGLCLWQGTEGASVCKTYKEENDLCDKDVWTITEDKDGNLWTGSRCGAKKLARYGFTSFYAAEGLGSPEINSIFENKRGELFVGTYERVISRFDAGKFFPVKPNLPRNPNYFGWGWDQTVLQDSTGAWWIPTGRGLLRFSANFENLANAPPEKIETGAKGIEVFRLFEDSRGDIWMATTGDFHELFRWDRKSSVWHDYSAKLGFTGNRIGTGFAEDRNGNLWIGTGWTKTDEGTALIRYHDGQFRIFTETDGLPGGWIRDLYVDHAGRLWIANPKSGVLRLDNVNADKLQFVPYTTAEGLTSAGAYCLTEDAFGRIYIGTARGLDRLNPETGQIENFTTADGLPNSNIQIAYRDRQNNLWFGTSNGLARFVPEPEKARQPPNVLITGLRVNGESQGVSILGVDAIPQLELASDQKQISVDFLGLGATLGERLKYEYRLGNVDWTQTNERTINFANFADGEYRFEVRTQTADRLYSQPATVSFRIAAPIWQRWWFLVLTVLAIAGTIYLFYKYRLQRLLEMEKVRTRIATDLHDDIGANLTRISLLSEVAKQKSENGNGNLLTSIADIARESVASMNDIVWAISPDHDSLLDLTRRMRQHAEEVFALRDIELRFAAPDADFKLSVGARRDLLLIFKEAVNNAVKYSDCSGIEIDLRVEGLVLSLQIKDNGKGFDLENVTSDGQGLRSMQRRAKSLGGTLLIESKAEGGTVIAFKMPLPNISRV
jgi:ligand-binding sensor domain-containing protein/two-component sensor histidine kinase